MAFTFTRTVHAADVNVGTWKLMSAKSTEDPPALAPKSQTNNREIVGDGYRTVADGIDSTGKAVHYEFNVKYDGNDFRSKAIRTAMRPRLKRWTTTRLNEQQKGRQDDNDSRRVCP
jgi:hypothetical protein